MAHLKQVPTLALITSLLFASNAVFAHGGEEHEAPNTTKQQTDWGIGGNPKAAGRVIKISMLDTMRFSPERIAVKQGETIRFSISNEGQMLHELVIGTPGVLAAHAAMMAEHPDMQHSEPYMVHVGAGKTRELVWTFNRPGTFDFACLVAGHFQAGMKGHITVAAR
jgi:uncharacterized cupredoxin-like copper-binding protein